MLKKQKEKKFKNSTESEILQAVYLPKKTKTHPQSSDLRNYFSKMSSQRSLLFSSCNNDLKINYDTAIKLRSNGALIGTDDCSLDKY